MGRFRICIGLYSPCASLWRASTGRITRILANRKHGLFLSPPDHRPATHHAIRSLFLRPRKRHLWRRVQHENADCWKRFVLSTSPKLRTRSNYGPIAVQGLGAGAITSSMQIVLSDLVTLRERGTFGGFMALCVFLLYESGNSLISRSSWAVGGGVGPVIGGSLAENGNGMPSICDLTLGSSSQFISCSP
jgi:hypothetical protein